MKIQIKRFSPHQNAKLLAVLMGICSLIYVIPMLIFMAYFDLNLETHSDGTANEHGSALLLYLLLPILYLLLTYLSVIVGCFIYNLIAGRLGGIEFELVEINNDA